MLSEDSSYHLQLVSNSIFWSCDKEDQYLLPPYRKYLLRVCEIHELLKINQCSFQFCVFIWFTS